jgi:hypothetical protein
MNSHPQLPLPTKEEAQRFVKPIADQVRQALNNAVDDWASLYDKVRHILSARTQSNIIHDHIVHHAKALLSSIPGVRVFKRRGIFTVSLIDTADIRFKKLDSKLRSNNVRTNQNSRYSFQLRLDGFADLPRLTAGYVLDDLRLAIGRAFITLQVGRSVKYAIPLGGEAAQEVLPFPKSINSPGTPSRSRVRAKKASEKAAGKE